jgi:hypothetical protein
MKLSVFLTSFRCCDETTRNASHERPRRQGIPAKDSNPPAFRHIE